MDNFVSKVMWAKEVLGLPDKVSIKDLKRIYRFRSKKLHPDLQGSEDKQRSINEAYKIILNYLESVKVSLREGEIVVPTGEKIKSFYYKDWIGRENDEK